MAKAISIAYDVHIGESDEQVVTRVLYKPDGGDEFATEIVDVQAVINFGWSDLQLNTAIINSIKGMCMTLYGVSLANSSITYQPFVRLLL